MSRSTIESVRIAGVATCTPPRVVDNLDAALGFDAEEVRKVVAMAGIRQRRVVDEGVTAADLCFEAARSHRRISFHRSSRRLSPRPGWQALVGDAHPHCGAALP